MYLPVRLVIKLNFRFFINVANADRRFYSILGYNESISKILMYPSAAIIDMYKTIFSLTSSF